MNKISGNQMKKLILALLSIPILAIAQEVTFSGYGATGYKFFDRNSLNDYNQEAYFEGKFQADLDYGDYIEAQLDFRGNSTDNSVNFREFSVKFEYWEKLTLKFGNIKKPFGYEYLVNRDELIQIDRSFNTDRIAELGYGGRAVSLMGYYKFDEDDISFPISYYLSLFRDNAFRSGVVARFGYHFDDDFALAANYMFQNKGGEEKINTHGAGIDFSVDKKDINGYVEFFYVQDPDEGIRRRLQKRDEIVYSAGAKLFLGYKFDFDNSNIKNIEPFILAGYFLPNTDIPESHVIQSVIGTNVYLEDNVRIRLNGDARFTKNQFNSEYTTENSRVIFEVQVRFD